ncbi:ATP-binding protein [Streptomyces hygroscopicus]|uniref:ATP-binding protein n=1 Tax=Streptomyces hygroscopicus TaxID=1912 RepID=UPI0021ACE223|nr:ATP-binding protein [Streptomyces hygroscopicus]
MAYHSAFVTIRTPAISQLTTQVRTLMILGRHQQTTARPSLILTGPAAAGETTALLNVGRTCHLAHMRQNPAPPGSAHAATPVAYVLVPPGATAKTLITEFARYLGIPVAARMTQTQVTDAVCHTYTQTGVQLVLIDEIHRLNPRTTTGAQTAGLLKDLIERLPATFVYAGVNVTDPPVHRHPRRPARRTRHPHHLRPPPRPSRHPRTLPRRHHRHRKRPRPPPPQTRHPPPARPLPPPAHRRPHRIPHPADPPSSHHRHPRRHRTHHQNHPRLGTTRPPRRNPPPPPHPLTPTHRPGTTALTSKNTKRAMTRWRNPQRARSHSAHTAQPQRTPRTTRWNRAPSLSQQTHNTPGQPPPRTPANPPPSVSRSRQEIPVRIL